MNERERKKDSLRNGRKKMKRELMEVPREGEKKKKREKEGTNPLIFLRPD